MKLRTLVLPLLAAVLALPATARAQNDSTPSRRPGMLGFTFDVTMRRSSESPAQHTIRVREVLDGSAADRAGMREGDLIVRINGEPVADRAEGAPLMRPVNEGDAVRIRVRRVDGEHDLRIVAGARTASRLAMEPGQQRRIIVREGVPGAPGEPRQERRRIIVRGADSLTGMHDEEERVIVVERDTLVRRGGIELRRRYEIDVDTIDGTHDQTGERRRVIILGGDSAQQRAQRRENRVIVINGDTVRAGEGFTVRVDSGTFPVQWLASRMDSLIRVVHTDTFIASRLDSLTRALRDSLPRMLEFGPAAEALRTLPDAQRQIVRLGEEGRVIRVGDPTTQAFFMDVGRAAAAGAQLAEMNEGLSRYFGGTNEGVLVLEVSPGSPARRAGLEAGDIIVGVEGGVVQRPEDVRTALSRDEDGTLVLNVVRQNRRREITLQWDRQRDWVRVFGPTTVQLDRVSPAPPAPPRP